LNGTIPHFEVSDLQRLELNNNQLIGTVPEDLSNLKSLRHLDLSANQLDGSFPSLDSLRNLSMCDASDNIGLCVFPNVTQRCNIPTTCVVSTGTTGTSATTGTSETTGTTGTLATTATTGTCKTTGTTATTDMIGTTGTTGATEITGRMLIPISEDYLPLSNQVIKTLAAFLS